MRKKRINPDKPLQELQRCINKLSDDEQGPVARRNARAAVLSELRRVRGWLDATYPAERKLKKVTRNKRSKWTVPTGWEVVPSVRTQIYIDLLAAGIQQKSVLQYDGKRTSRVTCFPSWAVEMWYHPKRNASMLKKARRSVVFRKATLMEERLRKRGIEETVEKVVRFAKKAPPRLTQLQLGHQIHKKLERSLS